MPKKICCVFVLIVFLAMAVLPIGTFCAFAENNTIDNSDLLPKWVPDSQVSLDSNNTPDWINKLIMMEVRIQTATKEGTLSSAIKVLDHCAEVGVNGIWLTPVYDPGTTGNGYGNMGPQSIDPKITGTEDYEKGWQELKKFIDEAHKRNIRIVLDVISWGTVQESPLKTEHPKWYSGSQEYGGFSFNWKNEEFKEWYINEVVQIALKTGCDGFRYDVEPNYAGYLVHTDIRNRLLAAGRKLLMISEQFNDRGGAYDLEQSSVGDFGADYTSVVHEFLDEYNIVDSIKNGKKIGSPTAQAMGIGTDYKYYINCITNHDHYYPQAEGKPTVLGYQAILSPFIPMWYIGEEFNNSRDANLDSKGIVLYFNEIKWDESQKKENKEYFEKIKKLIRIRRTYPEIFANYADEFKNSNICKVNVANCELTQPYARYSGNKAIIVVPNNNIHNADAQMTVYTPFVATGLDYYKNYTVTDALTGKEIVKGKASDVSKFKVKITKDDVGVYIVEANGAVAKLTDTEDETESYTPEAELVNEKKSKIKKVVEYVTKKIRRKKHDSSFPVIPVVIGGAVIAIGVGVTVFIIIKKRKLKNKG